MIVAMALLTVFVVMLVLMLVIVMMVAAAASFLVLMIMLVVMSAAALAVLMVVLVVVIMVVVCTETAVLIDEIGKAVVMMLVALAIGIVALLAVVMVMVVAAGAFLAVLMLVMMVALAIGIVAFLTVFVLVVMVVLEGLPVDGVIKSGIVDGMEHLVGELVLVDIQDGAHEVELHFVGTVHGSVVLDTVVHVDEIEGDPLAAVDVDGCLDVSQEAAGLALYELSDGHEGIGEPLLRIGVEVKDAAGESSCASACLFH